MVVCSIFFSTTPNTKKPSCTLSFVIFSLLHVKRSPINETLYIYSLWSKVWILFRLGKEALVNDPCSAEKPVSSTSDWLTVIGTKGRTVSYPVSCELTSCLTILPLWLPFYSLFHSSLNLFFSFSRTAAHSRLCVCVTVRIPLWGLGKNIGSGLTELYLPVGPLGTWTECVVILNCQKHSLVLHICCLNHHSGGFCSWLSSNKGTQTLFTGIVL